MKTDIEIAQSIELKPIVDVVEKTWYFLRRFGVVWKVQG